MIQTPKQRAARTKSQRDWRRRVAAKVKRLHFDATLTTLRWAGFVQGWVPPGEIEDKAKIGEAIGNALADAAKKRKKLT